MRTAKCLAMLVFAVTLVLGASCRAKGRQATRPTSQPRGEPVSTPIQELSCGALVEAYESGKGFFGRTAGPQGTYEVWEWDGFAVARKCTFGDRTNVFDIRVIPDSRCIGLIYRERYKSGTLFVATCRTGDMIKEWEPPKYWKFDCINTGISSNGRYAALMLQEDVGRLTPPDYNWEKPRFRIGLIDLTTLDLSWVGELSGRGDGAVRRIAVSDDGRYVAVGGWANGVAMVDASLKKVLWMDRPPTEVSTGYVLFSADGLTLYTAGSEGCLYTIDTMTGRIMGRRWASDTGNAIYGHRASCLAMSPDGLWLAAGTGPEGHVYLWSTTAPDTTPRLLPHGERTVLVVTFSPDSRYLASVAGGKVKIWSIPPEAATTSPATQPAETQPAAGGNTGE